MIKLEKLLAIQNLIKQNQQRITALEHDLTRKARGKNVSPFETLEQMRNRLRWYDKIEVRLNRYYFTQLCRLTSAVYREQKAA